MNNSYWEYGSSLKTWQKSLNWVIVVVFITIQVISNYSDVKEFLTKEHKPPMTYEVAHSLTQQAWGTYEKMEARIDSLNNHGAFNDTIIYHPREFTKDWCQILQCRDSLTNSTQYDYYKSIQRLMDCTWKGYTRERFDLDDPQHQIAQMFLMQKIRIEKHKIMGSEGALSGEDWKNFFLGVLNFFWWLHLAFMPFIPLVILIRRWTDVGWKLKGLADILSIVLCVLFWLLFIWKYKQNNSFKRRIEFYLSKYLGTHEEVNGWRIVYAYVFAIFFAVASFARPVGSSTLIQQSAICISYNAPDDSNEIFDLIVMPSAKAIFYRWQEVIKEFLESVRRFFMALLNWILFICVIPPHRRCRWYNLRPVRIRPMCTIPLSINGPPEKFNF